jgi:DNA-formamidopyrimidine glycosylase
LGDQEGAPIPEGPELRISRNRLRSELIGERITDFAIAPTGRYGKEWPKGFDEIRALLKMGMAITIDSIDVKGKFMHWTLVVSGETLRRNTWLHCSYGMSGQWVVNEDVKHPVVTFTLSSGKIVTFNDPRHFGTLKWVTEPKDHLKKLDSIGPDVLDLYGTTGGLGAFMERLCLHPKRTLAEVLMDQRVISGIGNYVKCESLYWAGLSPHRVVDTLTDEDFDTLFFTVVTIMHNSFSAGGCSLKTFTDPLGNPGGYASKLKVYGRTKDPKGSQVTREGTKDGRTTWWVPSKQR